MKLKILMLAMVALFSLSANAQTEEVKATKLNVEKVVANADKIAAENWLIQLKGNVLPSNEADFYVVKDETGQMKATISAEIVSSIGEYDETTIFYIIGKVDKERESTFVVTELKKP